MLLKSYFHILASALPRSVKIGIWQAHWLEVVSTNMCANHYQSSPKVTRVAVFSLTVTFRPRHCLCQETVAFGKSFVWILSILMYIEKNVKIWKPTAISTFSHFCFGAALVKEKWHLQAHWPGLVGSYQYAKIIKTFPTVWAWPFLVDFSTGCAINDETANNWPIRVNENT